MEKDFVRINVLLPEVERIAFDRWCRYGGPKKLSMSWRIRQLMRADADGKLDVPRTPPPYAHRLKAAGKSPAKKSKPRPARKR